MTSDAERKILEQRRSFARNDLEELAQQVEEGEIDAATADRLQSDYEAEIAEIEPLLAGPKQPSRPLGPDDPPQSFEGRGIRIALVALAIVAVLSVLIIVMGRDSGPPATAATGQGAPPATTAAGGEGMPSPEEMEAVVAANPEVVGMRLALADLYFEQGMLEQAASHYEESLEHDATGEEAHYALTRLGSIAYFEGRSQEAVAFLTPLVEADPRNAEARFYLGATLLDQVGDPAAAIPLFEQLLAMPDLAASARTQVEQMLEAARTLAGEG